MSSQRAAGFTTRSSLNDLENNKDLSKFNLTCFCFLVYRAGCATLIVRLFYHGYLILLGRINKGCQFIYLSGSACVCKYYFLFFR